MIGVMDGVPEASGERARFILAARCGACWAPPDWPCDLSVPAETEAIQAGPGYLVRVHVSRAGRAARKGMPVGALPEHRPSPCEDPSLPHQIVLTWLGTEIAVSCNCIGSRRSLGRMIIECRPVFPVADALDVYNTWHQQRGISL